MRALAVGIVVLALGAAPGASDGSRSAFGVGVLRRDGVIIPFGAFDGKRWTNSWPQPALELTIPIGLRGVPSRWWGPTGPLETWQVWPSGEPQRVNVVQTDWVNVHCVRQIGLRSDYTPPAAPPPRTAQPYPKDGLAVSPSQPVERVAVVPAESADTRALIPALRDAFNTAERKTEDRYHHPMTRRSREGRDPDIEAVYAAGDHPRVYYIEAVRRYRQLGQRPDECEAVAFGAGWFVRDGTDYSFTRDRRGSPRMQIVPVPAICCRSASCGSLAGCSGWRSFQDGPTNGSSSSRSNRKRSKRFSASGGDLVKVRSEK